MDISTTKLSAEEVRNRKTVLDARRHLAQQALHRAQNTLKEIDRKLSELPGLCPHENGTGDTCILSHSQCPDCGLDEIV